MEKVTFTVFTQNWNERTRQINRESIIQQILVEDRLF